MKLSELQTKITPGEWYTLNHGEVRNGIVASMDKGQSIAVTYNGQPDAAYLAHCTNHLPKVLEALRGLKLVGTKGQLPDGRWAYEVAMEALAAAEEVEGI